MCRMATTARKPWNKPTRRPPGALTATLVLVSVPVLLQCCSGKDSEPSGPVEPPPEPRTVSAGDTSPPEIQASEPAGTPEQQVARVDGLVPGIQPQKAPPMYGRAFWNVVTIYARPDMHSMHLGYIRAGEVVVLEEERVADKSPKKPRCKKGWWRLADGGGYVCSSRGVEAAKKLVPSTLYPSPPSIDQPMPYRYGHIMNDLTPLYERIPRAEEEEKVQAWIQEKKKELKEKELEKQKAEEAKKKAALAAALSAAESGDQESSPSEQTPQEEPGADEPPTNEPADEQPAPGEKAEPSEQKSPAGEAAPEAPAQSETEEGAEEEEPEEEEEKDEIPFDYVRMLMLKGFYVSIDREMVQGGIKWYRTVRGQFVKAEKVFPVDIRIRGGEELPEDFSFPAGIVLRENIFERVWNEKKNHILKNRDVVYDKFYVFRIFGKQIDKVKDIDTIHYEIDEAGEKMVLSWSVVPIMKPEEPPHEVPEGGKWIHVDVGDQTLTAYEGEHPVFLTLVSTGNEDKDEEYATPRGTFSIQSKHVSATMDNLAMDEGAYSIEDVPWTMYFHSSYALHGAFWHSVFGHQRSHGCVNMTPKDAMWIFDWSEPALPLGWHGVVATKERPGTWVKVTD